MEVKLAEQEGGKVDYEIKRKLVKEEQETIKKEQAERKEQEQANAEKEALVSNWLSLRSLLMKWLERVVLAQAKLQQKAQAAAPVLTEVLLQTADLKNKAPEDVTKADLQTVKPLIQEITKQDMDHIEDIIEKISKDKYTLLEKQDLKEEVAEYKEVGHRFYCVIHTSVSEIKLISV